MLDKTSAVSAVNANQLIETAIALVTGDKGLLAIDESNPTCNKRFAKLGIAETEERRRAYLDDSLPSQTCITANAHALARYAALCQEAGLVPIVELEVMMAGSHTLERCASVTERVLRTVFEQLCEQGDVLEAMLVKPNMVLPGLSCPEQHDLDTVAAATVHCLLRDFGDQQRDSNDDYPDFVIPLAHAVAAGNVDRGIAICGSGVGASIAANKIAGVRACLIHEMFSAHQGVEDDDLNIMCLGGFVVGHALAWELVQTFLCASFSGGARHRRRLAKVERLEFEEDSSHGLAIVVSEGN